MNRSCGLELTARLVESLSGSMVAVPEPARDRQLTG